MSSKHLSTAQILGCATGRLPAEEAADCRAHASTCPDCRHLVLEAEALRLLYQEGAPAPSAAGVKRSLAEARKILVEELLGKASSPKTATELLKPAKPGPAFAWSWLWMALLAGLAAVLVGVLLWRQAPVPEAPMPAPSFPAAEPSFPVAPAPISSAAALLSPSAASLSPLSPPADALAIVLAGTPTEPGAKLEGLEGSEEEMRAQRQAKNLLIAHSRKNKRRAKRRAHASKEVSSSPTPAAEGTPQRSTATAKAGSSPTAKPSPAKAELSPAAKPTAAKTPASKPGASLSLHLGQASFRPASGQKTAITLEIGQSAPLEVRIFTSRGQAVRWLFRNRAPAGKLELSWDGRDDDGNPAPAGDYFVRAVALSETRVEMLTLHR